MREIIIWPDDRLRQKSEPVRDVRAPEVQALIADMFETCRLAEGLGLAAVQVGVPIRLIVLDRGDAQDGSQLVAVANPVIVGREGRHIITEGCLSVPGCWGEVPRAERVIVTGLSQEGVEVRHEATGLAAAAFQHECDHLEGILYVDYLSPLKRDIAKRKMRKVKHDIAEGRARLAEGVLGGLHDLGRASG